MGNLLNNNIFRKFLIMSIVASLFFSLAAPGLAAGLNTDKEETKTIIESENLTEEELYQELITYNPNFERELRISKLKAQQLQTDIQKPGEISTQGALTAPLKALSALGSTIRHGGTALSWLLKPFSPKYGTLVKKHSRKISNVLAKPENGTKAYIEKQLVKSGIPLSDAKTITYWIFTIL